MSSTPRQPGSVLTVEFLLYIAAFLQLAAGIIMIVVPIFDDRADAFNGGWQFLLGVVGIIWGLILFYLARQMALGSEFARVIWVVLMVLYALGGIVSLLRAEVVGVVQLLIAILLIYLVYTPKADAFFEQSGQP
jgi:hypothetical protein